jgi:hypothetical protein
VRPATSIVFLWWVVAAFVAGEAWGRVQATGDLGAIGAIWGHFVVLLILLAVVCWLLVWLRVAGEEP